MHIVALIFLDSNDFLGLHLNSHNPNIQSMGDMSLTPLSSLTSFFTNYIFISNTLFYLSNLYKDKSSLPISKCIPKIYYFKVWYVKNVNYDWRGISLKKNENKLNCYKWVYSYLSLFFVVLNEGFEVHFCIEESDLVYIYERFEVSPNAFEYVMTSVRSSFETFSAFPTISLI